MPLPSGLRRGALASLTVFWTASAATTSAPPSWQFSSGFNYIRGDFGFDNVTEVFLVPVSATWRSETWNFSASIPWIGLRGPATVASTGGVGGTPARTDTSFTSGVGDVTLGAGYTPPSWQWHGVHLGLSGRVKLPTADDSNGLGTGATDAYAQVDLFRVFGRVTPFASLGYRILGDTAAYDLRDGRYASGGAIVPVTAHTLLGASLDWQAALTRGSDDLLTGTAFVRHRIDERWSTHAYVLTGFTDASPDFGTGASVSWTF